MSSHILQQDSPALQTLLQNIQHIQQLQQIFISLLEPKLAMHCQVANLVEEKLIVMVSSAAWIMPLNLKTEILLEQFKSYPELSNIKAIKYKVMPSLNALRKISARKMAKLSAATADQILEIANEIKDEKLREILRRIAENK